MAQPVKKEIKKDGKRYAFRPSFYVSPYSKSSVVSAMM